jgi:hypothetical protein
VQEEKSGWEWPRPEDLVAVGSALTTGVTAMTRSIEGDVGGAKDESNLDSDLCRGEIGVEATSEYKRRPTAGQSLAERTSQHTE